MNILEKLKEKPLRVFVNQPSKLQKFHKLHGSTGIAILEKDEVRIHFTTGPVFSQFIDANALDVCSGQ